MNALECDIYRSTKRDYLYVFVQADEGLSRVPGKLLEKLGEPEKVLTLMLTEESVLAKEDPVKILSNLLQNGYHLQLPPTEESFV